MQPITMITGATAGIGRATAHLLAQDGHHLILTGRRRERLEALRDELARTYPKSRFLALTFDVRRRDAVEEAIASLPDECMPHKSLSTTGKTERAEKQRTEKKSRQTLSTFCLDFGWIRGDGIGGI